MKKISLLCIMAFLAVIMFSCKDKEGVIKPTEENEPYGVFKNNPAPPYNIAPPSVGIKADKTAKNTRILHGNDTPVLEPDNLTAQLMAGQSICENKTLHLPAQVTPAMGDILFCFDLTGSMGGELSNVQVNSVNIMNAIRGVITDSWFGVISHMDYPAYYNYCGYASSYGSAGVDYPYSMDQSVTSNIPNVSTAIFGLSLGFGNDGPEDYTRVFHETWNDPSIGFRTGAQKFVVAFLDAVPHDCNYDAIIGGTGTTGVDPGRNGIPGDGDDLQILTELNQLKANGIIPVIIFSGSPAYFPLWQAYAAEAGGAAFQINPDGTIPDGTDIATYIAGLISSVIQSYDVITLTTCDPEYSSWLTTVEPDSYIDVTLGTEQDLTFKVCITVPDGTAPGEYCFDICASGEGSILAKQSVCITVFSASLDIKPNSCPNPLNVKDQGKLPVALLGSSSFDVSKVDVSSIKLMGVSPVNNSISDVAGPFTGTIDDCYDCTTAGSDGYPDLTLKFNVQDIVSALGTVEDRACMLLQLTGKLKPQYGGTSFTVSDIVRIQKR